ncbi:MAG: hypothetical protein DRR06_02590 [Gammaproteobacteria bacterium]|nr:MAG: hypothetical protein DRR06_02590 [Gammaproteobacteria bacterium]RLA53385.1 MAG: hypothetical protein DRR42_05040 [Gammaproteobacteria bacterium]
MSVKHHRDNARLGLFSLRLLFLPLLFLTCSTSLFAASATFGSFERKLATFDPGGRYLTKPIERQVPGLSINGSYYLWSDSLVSGQDDIGFRDRDFRALQVQNIFEVELNYRFSPNMEIASINHFLYDAVYDLESADGLYAYRVDKAFRNYDDSERIARELYFSYRTSKLDVVVGKQQIAWGKMDGQFIDVINSMDLRESVQLEASDYEMRRLPMWMANVTYYFEDVSLNLLLIPDFEENFNPRYGAPWSSPLLPPDDANAASNQALLDGKTNAAGDRISHANNPDWYRFSDQQFAARIDVANGPLTWGLIYYYAWERDAVQSVTGRFTDATGDHLLIDPEYERLHHFGFTSDYAWVIPSVPWVGALPIVFRAEALYTRNAHFTDYSKLAAAYSGALNNGVSEHDTVRAALAFEFALPANVTAIFQPSFYYTDNWHDGLGVGFGGAIGDRWNFIPVVFVEKPIRATRDRLKLNVTLSPYFSGPDRGYQGGKARFVASYEVSQYIKGSIIYTDYSGGDNDDLFGQYDKWDNIGIELQYEF